MNIDQNIGFLQGLLESMDAEKKQTTEGKMISGIVQVLADMNLHADKMEEMLTELNDYVESIDDDLSELEENAGKESPFASDDDEDDDFDFDDEDDDGEDEEDDEDEEILRLVSSDGKVKRTRNGMFVEDIDDDADGESAEKMVVGICPECKGIFAVNAKDKRKYACPHCGKVVQQIPLTPDNVPMAKPME